MSDDSSPNLPQYRKLMLPGENLAPGSNLLASSSQLSGENQAPGSSSLLVSPDTVLPREFWQSGSAFKVIAPFEPAGDQPQAIAALADGINKDLRYQTLLGVTGSGKTYTMAKVIEQVQKPTLVMAPNKTLAAQLASELKEFFPNNAVVYFVSYYDYYQPEAYVPASDTFIEKDASINEEVEKLRHAATAALLSRRDVVVVASVSCIYGIGSPADYAGMAVFLDRSRPTDRDDLIRALVEIQYDRNDFELLRGTFRVRGDAVDIFPPYADLPLRVELFGDEVERIAEVSMLTGEVIQEFNYIPVWPASHYVTERPKIERALDTIQQELTDRLVELKAAGKLLEAQRLEMRTYFDLEMLGNLGFTSGIENYSRHLDGRAAGEPPFTLIDYFPKDFLCIIDESHVTVPQIRGMHEGDRSRKVTLVDYGFRLPSALDNRPLRYDEFEQRIPQFVYVSATPGDYEMRISQARVEQIIRPTGLLDPEVIVRPTQGQIDDIIEEARLRTERSQRVLITTLTKKMAEDLSEHLLDQGINARYMHSDIATLQRVEILRDLRTGKFDVLVGINLLREGLDLPEVSLVAILDADKEGFLRNHRSLIQTIGRAARNVSGQVIMYADVVTASMRAAIDETQRRRELQQAFNEEHGIEPQTIRKAINDIMQYIETATAADDTSFDTLADELGGLERSEVLRIISSLEDEMAAAAQGMDFENAAFLRDQIVHLRARIEGAEEKDVLEALRKSSRRSASGPARRRKRTTKR
ncbi:MAG: excinuclease ABC subunit UvrB [Coriobacteriales bacterium]|nr:excinuclease ABC subunit UvrB [Coriobacteriales bacterium]